MHFIVYIWILFNSNCGGKPFQGFQLICRRKATSGPRIFYRAIIGYTKTVEAFCLEN